MPGPWFSQLGQSLVETSMVLPILFFIIFGIVEGSFLVFSLESANYAAQVAARVLSESGQSPAADAQALLAIRTTALSQTRLADVERIDFELMDAAGNPVPGKADRYRLDGTALGAPGWPPASRNVAECCADYVRVTIHLSYRYRSGLLGRAPGLAATATARLQPRIRNPGKPLTGPFPAPPPRPVPTGSPASSCGSAAPVWTHLRPALEPPPRYAGVMAYDSSRRVDVLFGGSLTSGPVNDTWEWGGGNWTRAATPSAPSPRSYAAMAYDPVRGKMILFGGASGLTAPPSNETWQWDGVNWTLLRPRTSPPPRIAATLTWNPDRGRLVLYGGLVPAALVPGSVTATIGDTWEFDGSTWVPRTTAPTPGPLWAAQSSFDPALGEVLYGGLKLIAPGVDYHQTWTFRGAAWSLAFDSARPHPRATHFGVMAYAPALGGTIAFGGDTDTVVVVDETWRLDASGWSQLHPATAPPRLAQMEGAEDPRGGLLVRAWPTFVGDPDPGTWELSACTSAPTP